MGPLRTYRIDFIGVSLRTEVGGLSGVTTSALGQRHLGCLPKVAVTAGPATGWLPVASLRMEVGLIFAGIGTALSLGGEIILTTGMFCAIVVMAVVTTLVAPIGLRGALKAVQARVHALEYLGPIYAV